MAPTKVELGRFYQKGRTSLLRRLYQISHKHNILKQSHKIHITKQSQTMNMLSGYNSFFGLTNNNGFLRR